jgi:Tannase and feruloyl esterase
MTTATRTIGLLAVIAVLAPGRAVAAATCEGLASLSRPNTTVTLAQPVNAGQFAPPAGRAGGGRGGASPFAALPAFCRVAATLTPVSDSEIRIEVWLPAANWNGKLQSVGNGAWAGTLSYPAMATALAAGYAAASTDTGHAGGNANFIVGHPQKLVDFEERAVHEMTVAAKAVVDAFYGRAPRFSYFNGCSTGGRQALTEVQRYPADYDAIIAGAPANFARRQTFGQIWLWQATHKDAASMLTPESYQVLHKAALDVCDTNDGVKDGVIENPARCKFDPKVTLCKHAAGGPECLTGPQVEAAAKIYAGASHSRTHEPLYPGLQPGSELGWGSSVAAEPVGYATDFFKYVVFKDEKWEPARLDFDGDVALTDKTPTGLNAVDADLSPFIAHGGKLLIYHGWSDPGIPPQNAVNYYQSVLATTPDTRAVRESVRVFMVPGMGHCGGGEGTSTFDMVSAVDRWVETKSAPERIPASRFVDGQTVRTRPLCAYPLTAVYSGTGSPDDASNFVCK